MAEEQTQTDQAAMNDSFWNSPVVVQDVPAPAAPPEVETPATPDAVAPAATPGTPPATPPAASATPGQTPPAAPGTAPGAPAKPVSPLDKVFGEGDKFNSETFLDFLNKPMTYVPDESPLPASGQAPAAPVATPAQPDVPPWKQPLVEEQEYTQAYSKKAFTYRENYLAAKQAGYNETQADLIATQKINEIYAEDLAKWRSERSEARAKSEWEASQKKAEEAELQPRASRNLMDVAREIIGQGINLTPQEVIDEMLYNPKLGGKDLMKVMENVHPGIRSRSTKEQAEVGNSFIIKFSSNINNVKWLAEIAKLRLQNQRLPSMIKQIRGNTALKNTNTQEAQMPKQRPGTPAVKPPPAANDPESWVKERPRAYV